MFPFGCLPGGIFVVGATVLVRICGTNVVIVGLNVVVVLTAVVVVAINVVVILAVVVVGFNEIVVVLLAVVVVGINIVVVVVVGAAVVVVVVAKIGPLRLHLLSDAKQYSFPSLQALFPHLHPFSFFSVPFLCMQSNK
jgi:hypothetical protein